MAAEKRPYRPTLCADGRYRCTRTDIHHHFHALLRFIDETDEVVFITNRGKDELAIMRVGRYERLTGQDVGEIISRERDAPSNKMESEDDAAD